MFDLSEKLSGKEYGFVYLPNILDFTDLYFEQEDELDRKNAFKEFVLNNLTNIVRDDGTIDVGFIGKTWQIGKMFINSTLAFTSEEGFLIKDLEPYNEEDKVIIFVNRKLDLDTEKSFTQ